MRRLTADEVRQYPPGSTILYMGRYGETPETVRIVSQNKKSWAMEIWSVNEYIRISNLYREYGKTYSCYEEDEME